MKPANFGPFLLVNLLAALLVGYLLDSWTHWSPWCMVIAILYAIIGSFIILIYKDKKKNSNG